jgi:arabinan endo-1,5-alpha-L-arabinosidase
MLRQLFLLIFLHAAALVDAYAAPGACSGACWSHDPAVIQRASDGTYFRFSTGGGIQITTASSIAGPWTIQGYALADGSSIDLDGNTDLWASFQLVLTRNLPIDSILRPQMFT